MAQLPRRGLRHRRKGRIFNQRPLLELTGNITSAKPDPNLCGPERTRHGRVTRADQFLEKWRISILVEAKELLWPDAIAPCANRVYKHETCRFPDQIRLLLSRRVAAF